MTVGVSVASTEDENDNWIAIWKDAAMPAFALRSYGNSQHTLSNRHTASNCTHSIRGNDLADASPASYTVNTWALSLGIRRSVRDTDGRRSSNVWIRTFTARLRYRTVRRVISSYHAMKTFQMAELSFRRTSISRHHAAWPRTDWPLAPFSGTAICLTDSRAARA